MKYVIAGLGKFGRIAFERISSCLPSAEIMVVERSNDARIPPRLDATNIVYGDAVRFLADSGMLEHDDVVIPMVPFHLAAAYVLAVRPDAEEVRLPAAVESILPNPFRLSNSVVCCSRADFLCPDDCPEGELCAVTGETRDPPLYYMIGQMEIPGFRVLVQRSSQILPGVGGYSFGELHDLADAIVEGNTSLATSCRCHGIITGIRIRGRSGH